MQPAYSILCILAVVRKNLGQLHHAAHPVPPITNGTMLVQRLPERIVEKAVKGMLPSGRIGRHLFTHLKVRPPPLLSVSLACKHSAPCLPPTWGCCAPPGHPVAA